MLEGSATWMWSIDSFSGWMDWIARSSTCPRGCHSAAAASPFSRCSNSDGGGCQTKGSLADLVGVDVEVFPDRVDPAVLGRERPAWKHPHPPTQRGEHG